MQEARRDVRAEVGMAAATVGGSVTEIVRRTPRIRLVATDLDGTLLAPDGTLSARTLATVHRLCAAGIALALATARRWTGTSPVAEALAMGGPLILYDGALVREYPSGVELLRDPLPHATARAAVELLAAHGIRPVVQYSVAAGELLLAGPAPAGRDASAPYLAQFAAHLRFAPIDELVGPTLEYGEVLRVVAFGSERRLRRVARELARLPCGRQLLKGTAYAAAELTLFSATASKGSALVAVAERLGIPLAETFAIGDGVNDIALMKVAGTSVAMGNASATVRRAAQHLTATHAEDGWAAAVEAHVLLDRQSAGEV
jgi:Cof subfamily protein (haloacid dehalogenase superfamily)